MSKHIESGLNNLKTKFLVGLAIAAPIIFIVGHIPSVFAASSDDSPKVCVIATLKSNPSIISSFGPCPKASPDPIATTEAPTPTETATTEDAPTESPAPTVTTEDPHTESPAPTPAVTTDGTHTESPAPTVTPTTESPSEEPTATATPTTETASEVYDIPPENKDPNTKEFRFCHSGAMHSNSFTGMQSGHHDKHATDIIPPIPYKFYAGWNWTQENAKTFYNNCVPVS